VTVAMTALLLFSVSLTRLCEPGAEATTALQQKLPGGKDCLETDGCEP